MKDDTHNWTAVAPHASPPFSFPWFASAAHVPFFSFFSFRVSFVSSSLFFSVSLPSAGDTGVVEETHSSNT